MEMIVQTATTLMNRITEIPDFRFSQKPQKQVSPLSEATIEGLSSYAYSVSLIPYGSIFLKQSECGLFKKNATPQQKLFLNALFEGYDGRITAKHIKSEDSKNNLSDIPMNVIFFSDPDLFSSFEMKDSTHEELGTGLARRFEFNFDFSQQEKYSRFTDEEQRAFGIRAKALGYEMFEIFKQINYYEKYLLLPEAKELLNDYGEKLVDLKNATKDPLIKREIRSREFKALKRSGRFAAINHPTELVINCKDMAQAILITEELGQDFEKFLKYNPEKADSYDKVFRLFKDNLGKEFSTTELKNKYYKDFGIKRKEIRQDKIFNDLIKCVSELACLEGYTLNVRQATHNGCYYSLLKIPKIPSSSNTNSLNNLLQS